MYYGQWFVRLLCPFSFESAIGLLPNNTEPIPQDIVHTEYLSVDLPFPIINEAINENLPQGEEQLVADPLEAPVAIGTLVWGLGISMMAIYSIVSLIKLRRKLIGATPIEKNIYIADHIDSPFVMGFIRPKIYLPSNLTDTERDFIIKHEQTHIKRLDHITRILSFITLAVHWFNPFVWIAFVLSGKDMETSCDESVMKKMNTDIRADYSEALLKFATGKKLIAATPLAFGEGDTKDRVKNVMKYKKSTVWVSAICLVLVSVIAISLMSNVTAQNGQIAVNGLVYTQNGEPTTQQPNNSVEIGSLIGIAHSTSEEPTQNFYATNLDEKYAGCPLFQVTDDDNFIYLYDYDGFYIPFEIKEDMTAMYMAQNLSESEIEKIELVTFPDFHDNSYALITEYGYGDILALINQSSGTQVEKPEQQYGGGQYFYITKNDGTILTIGNVGNTYLQINNDYFEADYDWLTKFSKFVGHEPVPENFHYGEYQTNDRLPLPFVTIQADNKLHEPRYYENGFKFTYDELPIITIAKESAELPINYADEFNDTAYWSIDTYYDDGSIKRESFDVEINSNEINRLHITDGHKGYIPNLDFIADYAICWIKADEKEEAEYVFKSS